MKECGYLSHTFVTHFYSVNKRSDWDFILSEKYSFISRFLGPYLAFSASLLKYDVFFISFNGYFIGNTPMRYFQSLFFKLAKKKVVVIPFGSDGFVYKNIRSTSILHALMISYPQLSRKQKLISKDVEYWIKNADLVIPGVMGPEGLGRWDVLAPSSLVLDLKKWIPTRKNCTADGINETVVVAHSPNHRGAKGTEFILDAIDTLKNEGLKIELKLLEKVSNDVVRDVMSQKVDILVEQIIFTSHGLSGLEGMASGLPTISNMEDETYTLPMRRWSFLNECPIVSASPETIVDVLRKLVKRPKLRSHLGRASREYVEKYHGFDSAQFLFSNVLDYLYGKKDSLINLYHPILGDYVNRSPKIDHPLVKNQILEE
ncbi:hypothetical protein OAV71_01865 [Opitutales bacterium]|nr:hypothetical protein [Opitutales bacterium]